MLALLVVAWVSSGVPRRATDARVTLEVRRPGESLGVVRSEIISSSEGSEEREGEPDDCEDWEDEEENSASDSDSSLFVLRGGIQSLDERKTVRLEYRH